MLSIQETKRLFSNRCRACCLRRGNNITSLVVDQQPHTCGSPEYRKSFAGSLAAKLAALAQFEHSRDDNEDDEV